MNRRPFPGLVAGALLLLTMVPAAVAQEAPDPSPGSPGPYVPDVAETEFTPPPMDPRGLDYETRELAPGVYAYLSHRWAVNNMGFVVGERGVLAVDAGINGEAGRAFLEAIRRVTRKPILYLVNTSFKADHSFGNYAFPDGATVIAHRDARRRMAAFDDQKRFFLPSVGGNASFFRGVRQRFPDVVFDDRLRVDLGGRVVEVLYFGFGNSEGDAVVHVPGTGVAFTGNLVLGEGSIPPVFEGRGEAYLDTVRRFRAALDVSAIVPAHGDLAPGSILADYERYLAEVTAAIRAQRARGAGPDAIVDRLPIQDFFTIPATFRGSPMEITLVTLHRRNIRLMAAE